MRINLIRNPVNLLKMKILVIFLMKIVKTILI